MKRGEVTAPRSVLHVFEPSIGGVPHWISRVGAEQVRSGMVVTTLGPTSATGMTVGGLQGATHIEMRRSRSSIPGLVAMARAIRKAVALTDPDIVHLHSTFAGAVGRLALWRSRQTIVYQPHCLVFMRQSGASERVSAWIERFLSRRTDALAFVSEAELASAEAHGLDGPSIVVGVPVGLHGVLTLSGNSADIGQVMRKRVGLCDDDFVLLCVGRWSKQKGQDRLLHWWANTYSPSTALVLVGEGTDGPQVRRIVGRGGRTVLVGPSNEVSGWMALADVLIQPSRWEGHSMVIAEAMAAGLPVIVTGYPGAGEAIRWSSLIVGNDENLTGLTNVVRVLRERPGLRDRLSTDGQQRARLLHSSAVVAERCGHLYRVASGTK
ncbi:glycosyltransferase [soil metagenome]